MKLSNRQAVFKSGGGHSQDNDIRKFISGRPRPRPSSVDPPLI